MAEPRGPEGSADALISRDELLGEAFTLGREPPLRPTVQDLDKVTGAAAAVEAGASVPEALTDVGRRPDKLGQLARVFGRMAQEVYARERRLREQVAQLRIEIDESKKTRQVAEITETDYFQRLRQRAQQLRNPGGT